MHRHRKRQREFEDFALPLKTVLNGGYAVKIGSMVSCLSRCDSAFYQGKKILISGGSSGIGKATALLLAKQGAALAIAARNTDRLQTAASDIRNAAHGAVVHTIPVDVSDPSQAKQAAVSALEKLSGLDILINNAGIAHPGYIQKMNDEIFESMMRVNYFGMLHMTRALLDHFTSQRSGCICSVSSLQGYFGIFGYTAYAASKFAVTGFSDCLRQELLPYNVKLSVVFPPDTDTPQFHEENLIKPLETKAISGTIKPLRASDVAKAIAHGIATGRYHIIPGFDARLLCFMYRHFPYLVRFVIDKRIQKAGRFKS